MGKIKPDREFFLRVLAPLGARPEEALMVGDSLSRDIRGAEGLDMAHVWLAPEGQGPCCPKGRSIRRLSELAELEAPLRA